MSDVVHIPCSTNRMDDSQLTTLSDGFIYDLCYGLKGS